MTARNEHTCKLITTAIMPTTDAYRENYDRIFTKVELERVYEDTVQCPGCGYLIASTVRDQARYDYPCPRCGVYNLSHFKPWSRPVPTKERGSYYPPPDPIRVFILSMLGALAFVLLWMWTSAP